MFKLAEDTGGEAVEARNAGDFVPQMIERIRARYGLEYEAPPSAAGAYHRIRVELTPEARAPSASGDSRAGGVLRGKVTGLPCAYAYMRKSLL